MVRLRALPLLLVGATLTLGQAPIERDMLAAHNAVRARERVGPLTWSKELESSARQWAQKLLDSGTFAHQPNSSYGQNLFESRGRTASAAEVVENWAGEAKNYDAAANRCRGVCGHYTQIVWRDTKQVGCAVAGSEQRQIWVCDYDPPGNVTGHRPF
jgi:uncharacterized protein YkwD